MFPGQGSQHVGMGKELCDNFPVARRIFEEASEALKFKIDRLCFDGPESDLKLTFNTQPALLVTSIAAWEVLKSEYGFVPAVALGHSLGEYSALVATGALTLAEAVTTVRLRGKAMQEAVPAGEGGMTAVLGVEDSVIEKLCHDFQEKARAHGKTNAILEPANFNCPGQVVVSGHVEPLTLLKEQFVAGDYGAKAAKLIPLPVSAPFHCSLMKPVAEKMAPILSGLKWQRPLCPIVHNVTGQLNQETNVMAEFLTAQVIKSVLWTTSVHKISETGAETLIELGSGKVLGGLVKKINRNIATINVEDTLSLKATLQTLRERFG